MHSYATTLYVDEVPASPERFLTIREAIQYLGTSQLGVDGDPDIIAIVVDDLIEPYGFVINGSDENRKVQGGPLSGEIYRPVRDSVILDGDADHNGLACKLQASGNNRVFSMVQRIGVRIAEGQDISFRNLAIFLTPGAGDQQSDLLVFESPTFSPPVTQTSVTLENVSFPNFGSVCVAPSGPLQFFQTSPGSHSRFILRNISILGHRGTALKIWCDSSSIEISNSEFVGNSGGPGIEFLGNGTGVMLLDDVSCRGNAEGLRYSSPAEGHSLIIDVGPGSDFSNNIYTGLWSASTARTVLRMSGTIVNPITVCSNGSVGLHMQIADDARLDNTIIVDNAGINLSLRGTNAGTRLRLNHCLVANVRPRPPVHEFTTTANGICLASA